jgi:hypothetical protein
MADKTTPISTPEGVVPGNVHDNGDGTWSPSVYVEGATITGATITVAETVTLAAGTAEIGKLAAGTAEIGKLGAGTAEIGKLGAGTAMIGHVITDPTSVIAIAGAAKGATTSLQPTVTAVDADRNGLDIVVQSAPAVRALTNADVVTAELSSTDNAVLDALVTLLGREPHNLVPNSVAATAPDEALTVDATAGGVQLAALHADTTHVFWSNETAPCRVTFDGSGPTTTNGHLINIGDSGVWSKAMAAAAKFIRTGAVSAVVSASQLKGS